MTSTERTLNWLKNPSVLAPWPFGVIEAQAHWINRRKGMAKHIDLGETDNLINYFDPKTGLAASPEELLEIGIDVSKRSTKYAALVIYIPSLDEMSLEFKDKFRETLKKHTAFLKPESPIIIIEDLYNTQDQRRKEELEKERNEFFLTNRFDGAGNEIKGRLGYIFELNIEFNSRLWLARTKVKTKRKPTDLTKTKPGEGWKREKARIAQNELQDIYDREGLAVLDASEIRERLTNSTHPPRDKAAFHDGNGVRLIATCGCQLRRDLGGYEYLDVNCGDDSCHLNSPLLEEPNTIQYKEGEYDFLIDEVEESSYESKVGTIEMNIDQKVDFWCGDCPGEPAIKRYHDRKDLKKGFSKVSLTYQCNNCKVEQTKLMKVLTSYILDPDQDIL